MGKPWGVYNCISRIMARGESPKLGQIREIAPHDRVTFADVAGVDNANVELAEVVAFLRNPTAFMARSDGRVPRNVLFAGPPRTGKTLLARAVAGEAQVPLFLLPGPDLVDAPVAPGAAHGGGPFEQARLRAPCVVFIDDLDAFDQSNERVGALSRFLVEIDGLDRSAGVIIMAATSRPEVLDRALVRPGRFDHRVWVDRPDLGGVEAILRILVRGMRLANSVNLHQLARRSVGMVGGDLDEAVSEAVLAASQRCFSHLEPEDLAEAIDRIQSGIMKRNRGRSDALYPAPVMHAPTHATP